MFDDDDDEEDDDARMGTLNHQHGHLLFGNQSFRFFEGILVSRNVPRNPLIHVSKSTSKKNMVVIWICFRPFPLHKQGIWMYPVSSG